MAEPEPSADSTDLAGAATATGPYAVLQNRDFLLYLIGRLVATLGQAMFVMALGWELYERTHSAFALGLVQLTAPKGTLPHRTLGWIWVALIAVVAGSSFGIHELRTGARAGSGRGARSTCCRSSRWSCSLSA